MTETKSIEELREEAKSLNVAGAHLYKDADKLKAVIDEAKVGAEEEARKKAPRMQVETAKGTARKQKLKDLNAAKPEYEHQYRPVGTDPRLIEAKGFEVVEGESLGDEIVVRTMRDSFEDWQDARNSAEADKMERGIDDSGTKIMRQQAKPKDHVKEKT